jgi:hypothetical protein
MSKRWKLCGVAGAITLTAVLLMWGCSPSFSVGVKGMSGRTPARSPRVLLSATNRTSQDYAFSCWLEIQTKSGWLDVSPSDDIRTLKYFRKGQIVQLEVALPPKEGAYRFHCFYEPLEGTPRPTRMHDWLMGLKVPGKLGTRYREFLGRWQWPRSFYSSTFVKEANAQP